MTLVMPGLCRHCGCSETNACRLADGDGCCWIDRSRTVCSNTSCVMAEVQRVKRARAAAALTTPRKLSSAEVHAQIRGRGRRRKGRAA